MFRWGLVGPGRIAQTEIAPAISMVEGHELAVVVSRDRERADQFAKEHGAGRGATSYQEMLADDAVDAVYIATPNALHGEQVVAAAEAGKHVLCDKPLATNSADARRAAEACRKAGVQLGMMFQSRRFDGVEHVAGLVHDGVIGRPLLAQVEMGAGGKRPAGWRCDPVLAGLGTINNMGVHAFDLLRYLLGSEVSEVTAMVERDGEGGVDTTASILLRFDRGTMAYVNVNHPVRYPQDNIALYGTAGRIQGLNMTRPGRHGLWVVTTEDGQTEIAGATSAGYARTLEAFARSVAAGAPPTPSGEDGELSVQLTDAIVEAVDTCRIVPVPA